MSGRVQDPEPVTQQEDLGRVASGAFGWSLLNTAVSRFGTLAIGVVLARVLGPESFGAFAVATVALLAMLSFNELGVSLAIVRWKGDPAAIVPTVNTISVFTSAALVALVWFSAPAFSAAMGAPDSAAVVRLMSLSILLNGVVASPAALLQRDFRQKRRMGIDQVNTWLGAIVSVVMALMGFGAMSLAVGRIAGSVVSGVLFLAWSPLPYRFGFDRSVARRLLVFGLPLAGASVIVFAVGYADQLTAGTMLGATALGYYVLAFNLANWPVSMFSQPLRSVAPAAFSRLRHDPERMNAAFRHVLALLTTVTVPLCFLIAGAAVPIVRLLYGQPWAPSADILALLGFLAVPRILFELVYDYLVVQGRSAAIFAVQVVWLVALVPALYLGARWEGLTGLAGAQLAVALVVVLPLYAMLLARTGLRVARLVRIVALPLLGGSAVYVATRVIVEVVANPLLACASAGSAALLVIAAMLLIKKDLLTAYRASFASGGDV